MNATSKPTTAALPPWARWPLRFAGVLAAAALLWFVGPLIALGGQRPLAGEPARWAALGALALFVALRMLWRRAVAARRHRRLMEGLVADAPGEKEVAVVAQRFEKAVALLKRSRLGSKRRSWSSVFSGRSWVDELPWYVIIGAPGAGKTTALANSGLQFPLAGEIGEPVIRGIGGTRNCDWWFASEAVLIDTAGRYTTHDSHREADRTAWFGFLALLARYRPRRPINGVLLTLSVSDLLTTTPEQRLTHAAALRERIEELHERLGIAFPVYVLVTKTDLLAGFMEFFADFDKDERAQVWGATFPYRAEATPEGPQALLATELAALEKSLNDCLIAQMQQGGHSDSERERRAAAHAFPQQWRVLRQALFDFLQGTLGAMPPRLAPMVRGVYFTSATQEGTPMDRALGGMVRALGLPARALAPSRPSGKTFFVTRLLRDVVFAESGLAGTNLRWRQRRQRLGWGLAGVCAAVLAASGTLAWQAWQHNRTQIAAVAARLPDVERNAAGAKAAPADDLIALLPALDALRALAADEVPAPALRVPGLDRGVMLASVGEDAYLRALREALLPRIAARLEARLRTAQGEHIELAYDALKAYLMLFGGRNFDRDALRAYLAADWDATLPAAVGAEPRAALRGHLERLLASGEVGAPSDADAQLVARTRSLVAGVPLAQRAWQRLKQLDFGGDAAAFDLEARVGAGARGLFVDAGGAKPGVVPALYSRTVFQQSLPARTQEVLRQFAREQSWVLGVGGVAGASGTSGTNASANTVRDAAAARALGDEVQALYLAEYAARWQAFLTGLQLAPAATLAGRAEQALRLSQPDSPLLALLRAAVHETSVVPPGEWIEALRRYVSGQPAPMDAAQAVLGKLAAHLAAVDDAARRKALPPASDVLQELAAAAQRAPEPVRGMLSSLAGGSGGLVLAATREPLSRQVTSEIAPRCSRELAGRYPLQRNGTQELSRAEFARAFGAEGLFDAFLQRQLRPHLDTSAQPWRLRGDAAAQAAESLQSFQRAQTIRDAFFRDGGRALGARLEWRALDIDPGIGEFTLDVDGQLLRFRRGAQNAAAQSLQWPGAGETSRVQVQVTAAGGGAPSAFSFQGPWALLRLLDRVRSEPGATPERVVLLFDVEGRKARIEVRSVGGPNPLASALLEPFSCPTRL